MQLCDLSLLSSIHFCASKTTTRIGTQHGSLLCRSRLAAFQKLVERLLTATTRLAARGSERPLQRQAARCVRALPHHLLDLSKPRPCSGAATEVRATIDRMRVSRRARFMRPAWWHVSIQSDTSQQASTSPSESSMAFHHASVVDGLALSLRGVASCQWTRKWLATADLHQEPLEDAPHFSIGSILRELSEPASPFSCDLVRTAG